MENENLKPVQTIPPFTKMIMTIGALPTSFYSSMSYYEAMVWLYEYLKNTIIPTINANGEAVIELQEKFVELKTWIDEYFDNLDLQEEVNKKLDEMATDGTLTNLIKDYVDPIYEAYEEELNGLFNDYKIEVNGELDDQDQEIASFKTLVNDSIETINTKVDNATSGSPLVASSTSEMTETDRVYVNTTDGKWYYYDGDSWEIGGTYQSTGISSNAIGYNELKPELKEYFINNIQLEIGGYNNDGSKNNLTTRCRFTNNLIVANDWNTAINTDDYEYAYLIMDTDDTFIYLDSWTKLALPIGSVLTQYRNKKFYVMFRRTDGSNLTNDDLKNIGNLFTINNIKVINTESDINHQFNGIDTKFLNENVEYGIRKAILESGQNYNVQPLFVDGNLVSGQFSYSLEYGNKVTPLFFEHQKIKFTLKEGYRYKLVSYNMDETWANRDTSWIPATDSDLNVTLSIPQKARLLLCKLEMVGNNDISDMIENFVQLPLFNKVDNNNFIHFSFDDVQICFDNLLANIGSWTSIYQEPFFKYLLFLHDKYGAKISLYCNKVATLNSIGNHYKQDFIDANEWLKIGYHSYAGEHMDTLTTEQAKTYYDNFVSYALTMAGLNSIDRIPRLDYYNGTLAQIEALRNTKCGIYGLLTADDNRDHGYLTNDQETYLYSNNNLFDLEHGMIYYSTNLRLDTFVDGYTSQYTYHENTEDNPYDELVSRYSNPDYSNYNQDLIIFTHEWQVYNSGHGFISSMQTRIEQALQFANDYNYKFDFVQNRVANIKSLTI